MAAASTSSISAGSSTNSLAALYAAQGDRAAAALRRPVERLEQEVAGTRVRLSAFGQAQSATAAVQSAARNLQDGKQTATVGDAKKAAETFVQAYNAERAALKQAGNGDAAGKSASTEDSRARLAAGQIERLAADNASTFKDAGIRVQKDGTLAVDAGALESAYATNPKAVVQALGNVGRAAEVTATRQLSSSGSVGAAVNNLSNRLQQLETQESDARTRAQDAQRAVEASSRRYGFSTVGAGAYLGIFGL